MNTECGHLDSTTKCASSGDCYPGFYCNKDGGSSACAKSYGAGNPCGDDEVCAGNSLCHFTHLNGINGKCVRFFSLEEGEYVGIELKIKGSTVKSNFMQ